MTYNIAVQDNHSYRSMDCIAQLTLKPKFNLLGQNVLAPWATTLVTQDLDQLEFVSLSIDASNDGHVKLLPIVVRYCKIYDGSTSVTENRKLLDFVELKGETAEKIAAEVLVVIQNVYLENKVVLFSANLTNTNFERQNRLRRVNVHIKVKNALQWEVIG